MDNDPEHQAAHGDEHRHHGSDGAEAMAPGLPDGEPFGATLCARPGELGAALLLRDHGGSLWFAATDIG